MSISETHRSFLQKSLERIPPHSAILSAPCDAGRFEIALLEAGHRALGIDQSEEMLKQAQEHNPNIEYQKIGLQEMDFHGKFEGALCMVAMEPICPADYPGILQRFHAALKPGGVLHFTADRAEEPDFDLEVQYARARAAGLPVDFGEVADDEAFAYAMAHTEISDEESDIAVYHYYPPLAQVRDWFAQADFTVETEGAGDGFHHFMLRKKSKTSIAKNFGMAV